MAIDNVTFVKALSSAASQEFKDRIGATTQANIKKIGETVSTYPTVKNEFINVLTNQVSKQLFFNKVWENPYKMFNRGQLPYGKSIESIFIDIVKGKDRSRQTTATNLASDLLTRQTPNVKVEYHTENFQQQYPTTLSDEELKGAFRNANGLSEMTARILQAPITGAEFDQFLMIKHALANLKCAEVKITKAEYAKLNAKEKANLITTSVKAYVKKLKFLSNNYNAQGVMTFSKPSDLYLFVPVDISSFLDVEQLANAFNISKVELPTRVLDIDNFQKVNTGNDASANPYVEDTDALFYLIDKDAIQLYETLNESESFRNPQAKYTNIWFDRWGIIASCHFANALKFYLA